MNCFLFIFLQHLGFQNLNIPIDMELPFSTFVRLLANPLVQPGLNFKQSDVSMMHDFKIFNDNLQSNFISFPILFLSFEDIEPGIYLNRGPRVELFTLDQRKPFTVCVVDIINHLAKLKLCIAIKLDVEIEEIERALKASEVKEKVIPVLNFHSFIQKVEGSPQIPKSVWLMNQ